ncbi:FxSxx-COOH system tetratricopeptide repeat protein [Streptomyces sp. SPB162]|uniref:FxSxx-COOH system tetratricopeptide repeat protein n=1 Tax=Streptomyces sp. SPB162 TaxID=2940560 RepID=UPI002406FC00|nr:FxSxx-COOH system tetratricopeptide repeat protein [Streptomyces sp. SPB162]MDF9810790.1 cellulose biosynthesis protein BcsQ/tetratricopeptide (TPR) repeat protein [Streptomyces sp. SPB162]
MSDGGRRGKIVTFYSYKGGTGRTMALANTAWIMASAGRRTLVVDWDLEAPGLDRFLHPFLDQRALQTTPGVLNLITDYVQKVSDEKRPHKPLHEWHEHELKTHAAWMAQQASIERAVTTLDWRFPQGGRLDYISAGRQDRNYSSSFSQLDWNVFYENLFGGEYLDALCEEFRRGYDYVLIDSRTGLSDISDICTIHFPDVLVNCFTLNDQNIDGAAAVARRVEDTYGDRRRIRILPVPMRVDDSDGERLGAARAKVRHRFDQLVARISDADPRDYWGGVEIPYKATYAYEEILATFLDTPRAPASLLAACERLTNVITEGDVPAFHPMDDVRRARYLDTVTRRRPPGASQVFLSYVPADRTWAEWIGRVLTDAGFTVRDELYDSGVTAGASLTEATDHQVATTTRTLAVLTTAYQNSPHARAVWEAVASSDMTGAKRTLVPVKVSDVRLRDPFADRMPVDLSPLDEQGARAALLRAMDAPAQLLEHPADPAHSGPRFPGARPPVWSVPLRNMSFTGRSAMLDDVRERLRSTGAATLLHGMGGVGKTQLALEYAHRFMADYDVVWWISAELTNAAREQYAKLAPHLDVLPRESISRTAEATRDALRRGAPYHRWLLVLDNADDPDALKELLVSGGDGHIIITTRKEGWARIAEPLEVEVFTRTESVEHLTRWVPAISAEDAAGVAAVLGDLPLAIDQAAAWLNETGQQASAYRELLERQVATAVHGTRDDVYPLQVAATWTVSIDRLREAVPVAVRLLELCAHFSADPISLNLLYGQEMADALGDSQPLDEHSLGRAIQELSRYALVKVDRKSHSLQVHRLVQAAVRSSMTADEHRAAYTTVHSVLAGARPPQGDVESPENRSRYATVWPHLAPPWTITSLNNRIRQLMADRMRYLRTRGEYDAAVVLGEELVASWTPRTGEDDRWTLHLRFQIANAKRSQGEYEAALTIDQAVHARQLAVLGRDDPHTLMTAGSITAGLRGVGRFQEALDLDRQTRARFIHLFGQDDPRSLTAANNLAVSMRMSGDCFAARDVDDETRELRTSILGENHPLTLSSMISLGRDMRSCGDYEGSLAILRDAYLKACRHSELGSDYPPAREAAKALATTLRRLGQLEEAERLTLEVLENCRRRFGDHSPETLVVWLGQAGHLSAARRHTEARDLTERLLEGFRTALHPEHPNTLACAANHAVHLLAAGNAGEARAVAEETGSVLERLLGPEHPFSLSCSVNLANAEAALGDTASAEQRYGTALPALQRLLRPNHPSVLVCAANHALLLKATHRTDEGAARFTQVLETLAGLLGEDHPKVTQLRDGEWVGLELDPHPI